MSLSLTRALAVVAALAATALVTLERVHVEGPSMQPTLSPGDRLAVLPLPPVVGRLVVLRDPRDPTRVLVKRCAARHPDGSIEVRGDNPSASTDSRHFGPVARALLGGRPVYRYEPAQAAGWLWGA